MPYITTLDPIQYDIKVISVDGNCITDDTIALLEGNESYVDNDGLEEHLYSPHDVLDNVTTQLLSTDQLELIVEACEQVGAQYFRIVKI